MINDDHISLIDAVEREVARPIRAAHQAGALAEKLFYLREVARVCPKRLQAVLGDYRAQLRSAELEDVLAHQLTYATRLASAPGDLIYEELHKLLSLCDEVFSLQLLGFSAPDDLWLDFESSVRSRLSRQRGEARMAAEDRVEEWKKGRWWYTTLLGA